MSLATQKSQAAQPQAVHRSSLRRVWKVPTSKARWYWLAACLVLYGGLLAWYLYALRTQRFPGPFNDPFRLFGIIAFVIVLGTSAYTLRRRFARGLPGKVQDWLWMHTWTGITAILIALLHENFAYITHNFISNISTLTTAHWGPAALFSLIFLVASGIIGRLIDVRQTHIIAHEASSNGVGIASALEERILELEYVVERLCAGKSEAFQHYCLQVLSRGSEISGSMQQIPSLLPNEHSDFQKAYETLNERTLLVQSLQRQRRARLVIRTWRSIHITLASLALLIVIYHSIMQLLINVFNSNLFSS